jgi:hypothetical protein
VQYAEVPKFSKNGIIQLVSGICIKIKQKTDFGPDHLESKAHEATQELRIKRTAKDHLDTSGVLTARDNAIRKLNVVGNCPLPGGEE